MSPVIEILVQYVCPSLGCFMASMMFSAPIQDLRRALLQGSLGSLNPFPWAMMTGNCLGWVVYGYYTVDPFVVAGNLPGLILSIWLNIGASKIQYLELSKEQKFQARQVPTREHWNASSPLEDSDICETEGETANQINTSSSQNDECLVMVPQERALFRILVSWAAVIVWVGWFSLQNAAQVVGIVVNINLVFFYGAPLQTIRTILVEKSSRSIHIPTMVMNWCNTSFWIAYGLARHDFVIVLPNCLGLLLGLVQGLLCLAFPREPDPDHQPLQEQEESELSPPEEHVPRSGSIHEVV